MPEIFEQATRLKLRFESPKGFLAVEDLWDLPLTTTIPANRACLNEVAKAINRQLKDSAEEDFVNPVTQADERLQLKLNIVKHIIAVKQVEIAAAHAASEKRQKKERLLELIARKQDEKMAGQSEEELQKMLAEL